MIGIRYWAVVALLAATAAVMHGRGDVDRVPPREQLSSMPTTIESLSSRDLPIDDAVLEILGHGEFLNRIYTAPAPGATPIGLFIAYFPTQRTGSSIHSPQNCLPGAGWTFESSKYTTLHDVNGKSYQVGEYVIGNGESRQFVMYWYQAHGRSIANEYESRAFMILDAIRHNRSDGALVRVITPILGSEGTSAARERVVQFASRMAPELPRFIPE